MKLFLLGTLLFSGGGAIAMQNETVKENVSDMYHNVRQRVQKRVKENSFDRLRENGYPYPSEEKLATLTEEQQTAILTAIDQINATYDWINMTDEEIKEALAVVQDELNLLAEELGLDLPDNWMQKRFRKRVNEKTREVIKQHLLENLRENGIEVPNDERLSKLSEEQQDALLAKIEEFNATYDWANMTDEEIFDAMLVVKDELKTLHEELDFPVPSHHHRRHHEETPENDVEDSDEM